MVIPFGKKEPIKFTIEVGENLINLIYHWENQQID